ncbi:glycosyltransferase family 4 protein [Empedobacter falsenii]|uniref:glycosyltransferase family 4 protein n=1 Tax=Empedobacter falsenii TaxID=343874 RepID=UPI00257871D4|nr:glycosyltransferase family 4 protein [Empedobacter falsenii]MDM1298603.1 glycosyltransferase family 4 protein [Empedobacter falsenii]MDM1318396.1 glycosyltransferase family 4 protein [Empedobacter falsenii]
MKPKFFIITTISDSLPFFKGQLNVLKESFNIGLVSSPGIHLTELGAEYKVDEFSVPMEREIAPLKDIKSLWRLYKLFKKEKPVVVHGNTPKASLLSMIAAYFADVPVRIYYVHGLRYVSVSGLKRKILMAMERVSCAMATDVIAVSDGVRKQLIDDHITKKEIQLIWNGSINGIDAELFNRDKVEDIEIEGIKADDFVFGFIGRVVKDKGVNELIEAFVKLTENYKNVKLLMLGSLEPSDPISEYSEEQIKSNKNIIYLGQQKDVKPYMKRMDTFVLPSYREGLCGVILEASSMNVPIIGSNIAGIREVVQEYFTGELIVEKNVEDLLYAMKDYYSNRDKLKNYSENSRVFVVNKYEQNKLWIKSLNKYKEIVNNYV